MQDLRGKTALVTGAASGIGRALADAFAAEGMNVVLADVEDAALTVAERELSATGAKALAVRTDVSKSDDVAELARRATEAFGHVDVLCNNAGVAAGGAPAWELSEQDWQWVLGVNLWGVIHGIRHFVPAMVASGREGHVVNTASMAGLATFPMTGPYAVSKHGVVTLSESMAQELRMIGGKIGVSVLCPGYVATNIGESARNRPVSLAETGVVTQPERAEMARQMIAAGSPPAEIAAKVVECIKEPRFYVLPHPDLKAAIRLRMEAILDEKAPWMPTMGPLRATSPATN